MQARLVPAVDTDALRTESRHPDADPAEDLFLGPAGLLLAQRLLVLVGEEIGGTVDETADVDHAGELLRRVGCERDATGTALIGVPEHAIRVVRADQYQVEAPDPLGDGLELDLPRLAHRAGVERRDLVVIR